MMKGVLLVVVAGVTSGVFQPQGPAPQRQHVIDVQSKTIRLPSAEWNAMPNEFDWAVNFEEVSTSPRHAFPRVVTIFRLPMTQDRRLGLRIADAEYLELFVVHSGTITAQVRAEKNGYWVLSRETFVQSPLSDIDTNRLHDLTPPEFESARFALQAEIDTTRFLLQSKF